MAVSTKSTSIKVGEVWANKKDSTLHVEIVDVHTIAPDYIIFTVVGVKDAGNMIYRTRTFRSRYEPIAGSSLAEV